MTVKELEELLSKIKNKEAKIVVVTAPSACTHYVQSVDVDSANRYGTVCYLVQQHLPILQA